MIGLPGTVDESANADVLAGRAAEWLVAHLEGREGRLAVCLTGGSTPKRLYALLTQAPYRARLPWDRVHWFWGDERLVPPGDERSNERMARQALLDAMAVPPDQVHAIPTSGDSDACAATYEQTLKTFYGADRLDPSRPLFDVMLLGMGGDGHTASLFPGKASLGVTDRWVVSSEPGLDPKVTRVTLTFPALASSRATAFLVSGAEKDRKSVV